MGKYLITGRQGAGKTAAIKELQTRSYTAYNTDDLPAVTSLQNISTGELIQWPKGPVDWTQFAWNWQKAELDKLIDSDDTVFIGAITSNQEQYYSLFNKIFALVLTPENLRIRLNQHEHESHHIPGQIDRRVAAHEEKQRYFIDSGPVLIDANRPVPEVVDQILANL